MRAFSAPICAFLAVAASVTVPATAVSAQGLEGCDDFQRFVEREDFPRALEELKWCRNSIEELHYEKLTEIVSRPIVGYEPQEASVEGALGIATLEGLYSNGADEIRLSITGGAAASSQANTGLGALAGLASAFGVRAEGTRQVRVAGLTGQIEEDGDGVSLMLTMSGGTIVTIEGPEAETVEAFAEEIIPDLEDYLG